MKDKDEAELEEQVHQKEEQIQAKNKRKAELEKQLHICQDRGAYYIIFNAVVSAGTHFIACTQFVFQLGLL